MNQKISPLELVGIIILVIIGINLLQLLTGVFFALLKLALPIGVIAFLWYYFSNRKMTRRY